MKIKDINDIKGIKNNIILATIIDTKGSVPRNINVSMAISDQEQHGTIGGGELEFRVINESKKILFDSSIEKRILGYPLGPSLGQCCGGYVKIKLEKFINGKTLIEKNNLNDEKNNINLYIFGAGHVSNALISKLDGVGFNIFIIDERQNLLSKINKEYVSPILATNPKIIIKKSLPGSYYLVLTHSHQTDLKICAELLYKNDFEFIGLIGSQTKKIRFKRKLMEIGHSENQINKIECPIGLGSIKGKEPDIIAIAIIARLLEHRSETVSYSKGYIKLVKLQK